MSMKLALLRKIVLPLVLLTFAGLAWSGCILRPRAIYVGPPVEYGYTPLLYNGYVVYYDQGGIPFYWYSGGRIFIPMGQRGYYVDHYHSHNHAYWRWHKHRGKHYRSRHYKSQSSHERYKHKRKPTLRPKKGRDKHKLTPTRSDDRRKPTLRPKKSKDRSKPTLKPKKKKKKEKKKKKKTLRPRR